MIVVVVVVVVVGIVVVTVIYIIVPPYIYKFKFTNVKLQSLEKWTIFLYTSKQVLNFVLYT